MPGSSPVPEGHVFIACSMDGFIARPDGDIVWLTSRPVPEGEDFGYAAFMYGIDRILMGSGSYLKVLTLGDWFYQKPVTVLSRSLTAEDVPEHLQGRVEITGETPGEVFGRLGAAGVGRVYVDGGQVIQSCLREGLIRRMTVTRIPVLLGEGLALFGATGPDIGLTHLRTKSWDNGFVQSVYDVG
jgi:dihydrofolate reductase